MTVLDGAPLDSSEQSEQIDRPPPGLPPQRHRGLGLIFQNSQDDEIPIPSPVTPGESAGPFPPDGSPSASEWPPPDGPALPDEDRTSSPSPSDVPDAASAKPLSARAIKPMFRQGVKIGSGMAYRFGARTPGQQQVGLYLADDEDAANIGDPLAAIAARREGVAGKVSPDTADAIQAMMGLAGWVSKQMVAAQMAAKIDAGAVPTIDLEGQA